MYEIFRHNKYLSIGTTPCSDKRMLFSFQSESLEKMQNLGLAASYRQHRELKKVIRKVMAIGYLPVLLVRHLTNFNLKSLKEMFVVSDVTICH
jgi:aspartate aminotransferase-like enzyme